MAKVNFENLRVCQLSEKLADQIWKSVSRWDGFLRIQSVNNWFARLIVSEPEEVIRTIDAFLG